MGGGSGFGAIVIYDLYIHPFIVVLTILYLQHTHTCII